MFLVVYIAVYQIIDVYFKNIYNFFYTPMGKVLYFCTLYRLRYINIID